MPSPASSPRPFQDALDAQDWERIEALWLDSLERPTIPITELLEVRERLTGAGNGPLAVTLLELLVETVEERGDHAAALAALSDLVRISKQPGEDLIGRLQGAFIAARTGSPSLRPVLAKHRLLESRRPLDTLATMARWLDHDRGTVVEVEGQGVGRVAELNLELETIKVDLGRRRPVSVPFAAATRFLRRLPADDFRRRAVEDPETLRRLVASAPGEALVELLASLGGPSDVANIRAALEGLVAGEEWPGWWSRARTHPRVITSGSGSRLRYSVTHSAESAADALLEELRTSGARDRLGVARRLAGRGAASAAQAAQVVAQSLAELESSDPGLAWETAVLLVDLPGGAEPAIACRSRLLSEIPPLRILAGVQDRAAREDALSEIRAHQGERWVEVWAEWILHEQHPATLSLIAAEMEAAGRGDALDASLEAIFRNYQEHPAQFVWACETMTETSCPEPVQRRMSPSLLEKLPDTLTRPEFGPLRARAKRLLDGGRLAVRLLLETATEQQVERFVARMRRVSVVEPQRLRVLEQAAVQAHGAARDQPAPAMVATRAAVAAKREELTRLLEVEIPNTLKGIQAAAAEGDLRENFEYHMLRDRQELQSARAAALQRDLAIVRTIEPGSADLSKVNIGTVVLLVDGEGAPLAPVTILGSWDTDVGRRIFANGSELAQRLLGRQIGDQVEVDGIRATIAEIAPWTGDR